MHRFRRGTRAFSSAGSEHLPYKQRVGGSNPSTPTTASDNIGCFFCFTKKEEAPTAQPRTIHPGGNCRPRPTRLTCQTSPTCPTRQNRLTCPTPPTINKKTNHLSIQVIGFCDPGEARTLDPLIKSQLLYQLSYGVFCVRVISFLRCKVKANFRHGQIFLQLFSKFFQIICLNA